MTHWWNLYRDRWAREQQALTEAGWAFTIDEEHADAGIIAVRVAYPLSPATTANLDTDVENASAAAETPAETTTVAPAGAGLDDAEAMAGPGPSSPTDEASPGAEPPGSVELLVRFPDTYPWFPPQVSDPAGKLGQGRHRQPTTGVLCLVHDRDWNPQTTAAELLATQLPRMLQAAAAADVAEAADLEVPVPEPLGALIPDRSGARILVDSSWHIPPEARDGALEVGLARYADGQIGPGAVLAVHASPGWRTNTMAAALGNRYELRVRGRWLRLDHLDPHLTPRTLWKQATAELHALRHDGEGGRPGDPVSSQVAADPAVQVIGLLVPSETSYRTPGKEWFFLLRSHPDRPQDAPERGPGGGSEGQADHQGEQNSADGRPVVEMFHSCAAGPADMSARTPATAGLRDRAALVVGVGALGSVVATELARAGIGRLDLADGDYCDPATACRQIAPLQYAGLPKSLVLRQMLSEQHPYLHVHGHVTRIGCVALPTPGHPNTHPAMAFLVKHSDLVIDAAADPAVSRYLAALCLALETTLLHVSATAGAWGGTVALFPPGQGGCWWCMLHHRADTTLPVPPAAHAEEGTIVPAGCATATFTGTGADLATIATHAARVAIDHLTSSPATAPATAPRTAEVHVAALRDGTGAAQPVTWTTAPITVHPACPTRTAHPRPDGPDAANGAALDGEKREEEAPADGDESQGEPEPARGPASDRATVTETP